MTTTIALLGAAGKIGSRIARLLNADANYTTLFVEAGEAGQQRLRQNGLIPSVLADAVSVADVVILAVPDLFIGKIASEISLIVDADFVVHAAPHKAAIATKRRHQPEVETPVVKHVRE